MATADAKFRHLYINYKVEGRETSWLLHRKFAGRRSVDTLESLDGLAFVYCPDKKALDPSHAVGDHGEAQCDMSGFTALRDLSIRTDHRLNLRLPLKLETLEVLTIEDSFSMAFLRNVPASSDQVLWDVRPGDPIAVHRPPYARRPDRRDPTQDDPTFAEDEFDAWIAKTRSGRPSWAGLLRGGVPKLRSLTVHGQYWHTRMDLEGFKRDWPQGLALRDLKVTTTHGPFELAVRDAELLWFGTGDDVVTVLSSATSVEGLLEGPPGVVFAVRFLREVAARGKQ